MNINIKINKILMAAVLLLTFSMVSEAAEFSIGNYTVNESEQITSQIELKDVVNFGTATISLLYDPSVVQVATVSNGNIPATTMTNNINFPVNGSTRILVFTSDVPGPNGSFIFSNISLKAVGNGGSQSSLSISIQEFADPDGHPINYTVRNGTFSIKPPEIGNNKTPIIVQPGSIAGMKFNDTNNNGAKDAGEPGLANWQINLTKPDGTTTSKNTDNSGNYNFTNLAPGTYTVSETQQAGWTQTLPAAPGTYSVTLAEGQNVVGKDFGNNKIPAPTELGSISGFKINDLNGNGKQDKGEKGLSGWNIRLIGIVPETAGINKETRTDDKGFYSFKNLPAGMYILVETLKGGYVPTDSPVIVVTLKNGKNSMNNNFTNRPISSLIPDLS